MTSVGIPLGDAAAGAPLSPCERYRYRLWREWDQSLPRVTFVMLNPSTADANATDPTLTRCVGFAKGWGFGRLDIVNLFAFRATDPVDMFQAAASGFDIVCLDNQKHLYDATTGARLVVAAWGANPRAKLRAGQVEAALRATGVELHCIRVSKHGAPEHPLYLPGHLQPVPFGRGGAT